MRLDITQRADLAVRALVVLDQSAARLKSSDLAAALGTTAGFVPQVMGPLVRHGWVHSVPGPTGGYEPLVEVDTLNVLEVVEAVEGAGVVLAAAMARPTRAVVLLRIAPVRQRTRARCTLRGGWRVVSCCRRWPRRRLEHWPLRRDLGVDVRADCPANAVNQRHGFCSCSSHGY